MSYNPSIPLPTDNLSVSQGDIKTNFTVNNTCIGVDHIPPSIASQSGYHKQAHIISGSDPANVSATNILYCKDYTPNTTGGTADTQLFNITASGIISQMSGKLTGADGWAWVGGILVQWGVNTATTTGSFSSGTATGTVTFKDRVSGAIPFPTNCYVVIPATKNNADPTGSRYAGITIITKSTTNFTWSCNGSSSAANGFYWMAIGN